MPQLKPTRLLWMDLEMTGLEPESDRIIEAAIIITDFAFNELATYQAYVKQPKKYLEQMKQAPWYNWSTGVRTVSGSVHDMHQRSGLIAKLDTEGKPGKLVEGEIRGLVEEHFTTPAILAGNSIHQDRRFIRAYWPKLDQLLHYRMFDVSTFKIWMQGTRGQAFKKPDAHRALDDIRSSIDELKYYLELFANKP